MFDLCFLHFQLNNPQKLGWAAVGNSTHSEILASFDLKRGNLVKLVKDSLHYRTTPLSERRY
jgi:hypothetical protein